MPNLFVGLVAIAAFLLGLRAGIAIGYRAERRRKSEQPRARA
jgi:hypothetical protein